LVWQGFLEGRYQEVKAGDAVTGSMDVIEASSAEEAAMKGGNGGNGSNNGRAAATAIARE
jgi:hypothetical protein